MALTIVASVAVACGGSKALRVDDSRLVRLSGEDRQALIDGERALHVAESNLEAVRAGLRDANRFREMVVSEARAAQGNIDAAAQALEMGRRSEDDSLVASAEERLRVAELRAEAASAKATYATSLVRARKAAVKEREVERDLAVAELELAKLDLLRSRGMAGDLDRAAFETQRREAAAVLSETRRSARQLRQQAEGARVAWEQQRKRYLIAARDAGEAATDVPPPADPLGAPTQPRDPQNQEPR